MLVGPDETVLGKTNPDGSISAQTASNLIRDHLKLPKKQVHSLSRSGMTDNSAMVLHNCVAWDTSKATQSTNSPGIHMQWRFPCVVACEVYESVPKRGSLGLSLEKTQARTAYVKAFVCIDFRMKENGNWRVEEPFLADGGMVEAGQGRLIGSSATFQPKEGKGATAADFASLPERAKRGDCKGQPEPRVEFPAGPESGTVSISIAGGKERFKVDDELPLNISVPHPGFIYIFVLDSSATVLLYAGHHSPSAATATLPLKASAPTGEKMLVLLLLDRRIGWAAGQRWNRKSSHEETIKELGKVIAKGGIRFKIAEVRLVVKE